MGGDGAEAREPGRIAHQYGFSRPHQHAEHRVRAWVMPVVSTICSGSAAISNPARRSCSCCRRGMNPWGELDPPIAPVHAARWSVRRWRAGSLRASWKAGCPCPGHAASLRSAACVQEPQYVDGDVAVFCGFVRGSRGARGVAAHRTRNPGGLPGNPCSRGAHKLPRP